MRVIKEGILVEKIINKNVNTKELTDKEFLDLVGQGVKEAIKDVDVGDVERKGILLSPADKKTNLELTVRDKINKFFVDGVFANNIEIAKDLGEGVGSAGGYLVPTELSKAIIEGLPELSPVRLLSTVIPVGTATGTFPSLATRPVYSWGTENAAIAQSDAVFGELPWGLNDLNIFTKLSRQLAADAIFDVGKYLEGLFVEQFAAAENFAFTNGTGSGQPEGFRNATGITSIALATANTLAYKDIVSATYGIKARYRANSVFMTSTLGMERIKQLVDSNGRPIFDPNSTTLMGKPVIENPDIPENLSNGATTPVFDATELWFGNFSYYYIFDSNSFEVRSTMEGTAMQYNQIWIASTGREDAKVALPEAFVKISQIE